MLFSIFLLDSGMADKKNKNTVEFKSDENNNNQEATIHITSPDLNEDGETELLNKKVNVNVWQDVSVCS